MWQVRAGSPSTWSPSTSLSSCVLGAQDQGVGGSPAASGALSVPHPLPQPLSGVLPLLLLSPFFSPPPPVSLPCSHPSPDSARPGACAVCVLKMLTLPAPTTSLGLQTARTLCLNISDLFRGWQ